MSVSVKYSRISNNKDRHVNLCDVNMMSESHCHINLSLLSGMIFNYNVLMNLSTNTLYFYKPTLMK